MVSGSKDRSLPSVEEEILRQIRQLKALVVGRLGPGEYGLPADMREQYRLLTQFLERIVASGRADERDLTGLITIHTSRDFDDWLRLQARGLSPDKSDDELNDFLFDDELRELRSPYGSRDPKQRSGGPQIECDQ